MELSSDIIAKLKRIELRARHLVTDVLAGEYVSAFKGQGMEFDEVRPYVPGDDVRLIDWNVTARMQSPFVKIHREERELTMLLVVDVSGSQNFGGAQRKKLELAAEVAAIFALMASQNNDRVGLITFSDDVESMTKPAKGRAHVWSIIRSIMLHKSTDRRTKVKQVIDTIMMVAKRRWLCIVISDFRGMDDLALLQRLRSKHDLICVELRDPLEEVLPPIGMVETRDMETGDLMTLDFSDERLRAQFAEGEREHRQNIKNFLARMNAGHIICQTSDDAVAPIEAFLKRWRGRARASK